MIYCTFHAVGSVDGRSRIVACSACGVRLVTTLDDDSLANFRECKSREGKGGRTESQGGPGTELKSLLARIGIVASPGCKCNARAKEMDDRGVAWCEANIDAIVGWLAEEHKRQSIKIPFVSQAARIIVKLAIRRAKKKGS